MKKKLVFGLLLLIYAEVRGQVCPASESKQDLHVNNLRLGDLRFGTVLQDLPMPGAYAKPVLEVGYGGNTEWPTPGLFNSEIWIGGIDTSGTVRVSGNYHPNLQRYIFTAGPLNVDGQADSTNCKRWDKFWAVKHFELTAHRTDMADGVLDNPLQNIVGWPGKGNPHFEAIYGFQLPNGDLAPFFDLNGDSIYNAYDGDFPHVLGLDTALVPGQISWCIYNDLAGGGLIWPPPQPIGFDYQLTTWALLCTDDDLLNNTFFLSQKLTNRTGQPIDSVVLGMRNLFSIGRSYDNGWGTAVGLNTIYAYNRDSIDNGGLSTDPEFGLHPPAFALTYLSHPLFKSIYFMIDCDMPLPMYIPQEPKEYYNYLNGHWRDGQPLVYGGSGYPSGSNSIPADFTFPGFPGDDTDWWMLSSSAISSYPSYCINPVASVYLGTIQPGESRTVDMAYSYHRNLELDHFGNVSFMFDRVAQLHQLYQDSFAQSCAFTPCIEDCVWPGDANRDGIVNHCDFLPLKAGWSAEGLKREGFVTWAPHEAEDWPQHLDDALNFKHLDANGDGKIEQLDLNVMVEYRNRTIPDYTPPADEYPVGDELEVFAQAVGDDNPPTEVQPGNLRYVRARITDTIPELFGLAYTMEYDTNYWQQSPVTLVPFQVLAIEWREFYPGIFHHAKVAPNQADIVAPGNLFPARLHAKTPPPGFPDTTWVRLKNIKGIRADGSGIPLGALPLRFCFSGGDCPPLVSAGEISKENIRIFPNPAQSEITIEAVGEPILYAALYDVTGRVLREINLPGMHFFTLPVNDLPRGVVFLHLHAPRYTVVKKSFCIPNPASCRKFLPPRPPSAQLRPCPVVLRGELLKL